MGVDVQVVFDLLARYGYAIVFLAAIAEAMPLLGLLVPGQAIVVLAGAVAATGRLSIVVLILLTIPAGILGDAVSYYLGRHYGRPMIERFGARLRIEPAHLARADELFDKWGAFALVLGRFSFLTRGITPLLAGSSRVRPAVFWPVNVVGAIAWALAYTLLGFAFGASYLYIESVLGRILSITAIAVVGLFVLYRLFKKYAHQFTREDLFIVLLGVWGGVAFGIVADMVDERGSDNPLDALTPAFDRALEPVAAPLAMLAGVANLVAFSVVSLALLAWLAWKRRPWEAGLVGFGMGGILVLASVLRLLVTLPDDHAAFPSVTAAAAVTFAGILTYLAGLRARSASTVWLVLVAGALATLVLGVAPLAGAAERPSDVAGGFALGIAWLALSVLVTEFALKHDPLPRIRAW